MIKLIKVYKWISILEWLFSVQFSDFFLLSVLSCATRLNVWGIQCISGMVFWVMVVWFGMVWYGVVHYLLFFCSAFSGFPETKASNKRKIRRLPCINVESLFLVYRTFCLYIEEKEHRYRCFRKRSFFPGLVGIRERDSSFVAPKVKLWRKQNYRIFLKKINFVNFRIFLFVLFSFSIYFYFLFLYFIICFVLFFLYFIICSIFSIFYYFFNFFFFILLFVLFYFSIFRYLFYFLKYFIVSISFSVFYFFHILFFIFDYLFYFLFFVFYHRFYFLFLYFIIYSILFFYILLFSFLFCILLFDLSKKILHLLISKTEFYDESWDFLLVYIRELFHLFFSSYFFPLFFCLWLEIRQFISSGD